jgi:hypothetical protein
MNVPIRPKEGYGVLLVAIVVVGRGVRNCRAAGFVKACVCAAPGTAGTRVDRRAGRRQRIPMPAGNYASTRYRGFDEINRRNVKSSQVAFALSLYVAHAQKSATIGGGGTLYVFSLLR